MITPSKRSFFLLFSRSGLLWYFLILRNFKIERKALRAQQCSRILKGSWMWESAYEMFKDHPVFGVGIGQYASKYLNEYKSPEAKEKQNHCHNNFLQMLAENGVAGFIGFCLLFGYILLSSLKNAFFKCSPYYVLIFGSSLALLLQGFTEYNFGNSAVIKYYWATLGCLLVLAHQTENKASANSFSLFQHTKTEI